ncbi:flavodoxin family protein [Thermococcus thermotolerans]|uniref:flavodoxin family protein n=1 Tax=Thermococcus thermotolerans TaxID=2969672 RepID=UPI002157280C|nr:flavodoxin family protein [Thermococcus thermotolerans]
MRALGVAFSARKSGNCARILEFCLQKFEERGFETKLIEAYDLKITPCSHCSYECFSGKCPIADDVPRLYMKSMNADLLIFAVPTYGGHASGLYRAFSERGQAIFKSYEEWDAFTRKLSFIVVGNLSSGGDMALHEVLYGLAGGESWPEAILLSSNEYSGSSLKGEPIEHPEVGARLERFVERIAKKMGGWYVQKPWIY